MMIFVGVGQKTMTHWPGNTGAVLRNLRRMTGRRVYFSFSSRCIWCGKEHNRDFDVLYCDGRCWGKHRVAIAKRLGVRKVGDPGWKDATPPFRMPRLRPFAKLFKQEAPIQ
jgi:hypothetical protein